MEARDAALLEWRKVWDLQLEPSDLPLVQFQQQVLRPLLKLQNPMLVAFLASHLTRHAATPSAPNMQKEKALLHFFQKEPLFGQGLRHLILGCMTVEEYQFYLQHQADLNKRLNAMLQQRLLDQWPTTGP